MAAAKILLVDDVNLILELEKGFLKTSPVRVFTARNGEEALAVAQAELPDLIFLDLHMPKMNGAECCAALKADPKLQAIPVVMVTTAGRPEDETLCRQSGCDDYVTKPIDRRAFLDKGRKFIPDIDRRETRVPCQILVRFIDNGATIFGISRDISTGGVYVAAEEEISLNSQLQFSFVLPDQEATIVEATGRVAWVNGCQQRKKAKFPAGFGVEFTEINPDYLKAIRVFVDENRPQR